MFCTQCGNKVTSNDAFCNNCRAANKEYIEQPLLRSEEPDKTPINEKVVAEKAIKNTIPKWLIPSLVLFVVVGLGGFFIGKSYYSAKAIPQDTTVANLKTADTNKEAPETPTESVMEIEKQALPAYLKVNQVDSGQYEQGKVDIYFSLFSDEQMTQPLDTEHLTKDMFQVNGSTIDNLSKVNEVDTVSVNMVLDKSGSMTEPPNNISNQSKMSLVREAAIQFLYQVPANANGQFELLSFSTYSPTTADIPFSSDRPQLVNYLSTLESDEGQTALYDSLTKALYDTDLQSGPKYIIAFTDGLDSNYGSSSQSVVDLSRQLGIPIYTVGFGTESSELQWISEQTGGKYFTIQEQEDLNQKLQQIYKDVFNQYMDQYKLTYTPKEKVSPGSDFSIAIQMKNPNYTAETTQLTYTRKIDSVDAEVMNALFEYQVNYAKAVNTLDFNYVSSYVDDSSDFYKNLKNRIEIDYVNASNKGKPKIIDPLENYRIESVDQQMDGSYKIVFFKFFPLLMNDNHVYEADLNTYTMVQDEMTGDWQVRNFARNECSIYKDQSDSGVRCTDNAVKNLYSGDPWPKN